MVALNRRYFADFDWSLLGFALLLGAFGAVEISSAQAAQSPARPADHDHGWPALGGADGARLPRTRHREHAQFYFFPRRDALSGRAAVELDCRHLGRGGHWRRARRAAYQGRPRLQGTTH